MDAKFQKFPIPNEPEIAAIPPRLDTELHPKPIQQTLMHVLPHKNSAMDFGKRNFRSFKTKAQDLRPTNEKGDYEWGKMLLVVVIGLLLALFLIGTLVSGIASEGGIGCVIITIILIAVLLFGFFKVWFMH